MIIYLFSLPIWNAILPAYAFWHFDDFSWGATRQIEGEKEGGDSHGDKEGEFDPSHIIMRRWAEFERDRRYKTGSSSRDSLDDLSRSPRKQDYRRSVISNYDSIENLRNLPHSSASRGSLSGPPLIELPTPLSTTSGGKDKDVPPPVPKIPTNLQNYGDLQLNHGIEQQPFFKLSPGSSPDRGVSNSKDYLQLDLSTNNNDDNNLKSDLNNIINSSISINNDNHNSSHYNNNSININNNPSINLIDQGPIGESPRRVVRAANKRRGSPGASLALEELATYNQRQNDDLQLGSSHPPPEH